MPRAPLHLQAYLAAGKPPEALSEAERLVISLMRVPRAAGRLRTLSLSFSVQERHAEAAAILQVCGCVALDCAIATFTLCQPAVRTCATWRYPHHAYARVSCVYLAIFGSLFNFKMDRPPARRRRTTRVRRASLWAPPRWRRCWRLRSPLVTT